jgi:GT2 family glycosyltransferase
MVDVARPLEALDGLDRYPDVRVYVTDGPDLVGSVDIHNARRPVSEQRLRDEIAEALGLDLVQRAMRSALSPGNPRPPRLPPGIPVSIVVPTCGRKDDLRRCLASLFAQRTERPVEVIVVDNRPHSPATRDLLREFPTVRVVEEHRQGLSYARNAGFAAAAGDILVATDDDVIAPPDWLEKLVAPFARAEVMAVTGNVLPLELETESQVMFEAYGGLGKGFGRLEVGGDWFRRFRSSVPTWILGATANAAFRASVLEDEKIGMLDEALGAGTPTGCSEDTYLFYRILKQDHTLVYDPSAWVWHRHRDTMESLRQQLFAYSKGHVAYHLTTLMREGDRRALIRLGWSLPRRYAGRALSTLRGHSEYPLALLAVEIAGSCAGPFALWRSRGRVRRFGPGLRRERHSHRARGPNPESGTQPSPPPEASHAL